MTVVVDTLHASHCANLLPSSVCPAAVCTLGQTVSPTGLCEDCPNDFYQDVGLPDRSTVCQPCGDDRGTRQDRRTSETDCERESVWGGA